MPEKKTPVQRRIRPSVPAVLEVDGKKVTFQLAFDTNAIVLIEEQTGLSGLNVFTFWVHLSVKVLTVMFWASLLKNHPEYEGELGLRAVRGLLDPDSDVNNLDRSADALWEAYLLYLGPSRAAIMRQERERALKSQQDAESPNPPTPEATPAPSSTGSDSGPSPVSTSASA